MTEKVYFDFGQIIDQFPHQLKTGAHLTQFIFHFLLISPFILKIPSKTDLDPHTYTNRFVQKHIKVENFPIFGRGSQHNVGPVYGQVRNNVWNLDQDRVNFRPNYVSV